MRFGKRLERSGKRGLRALLGWVFSPQPVEPGDFDRESVGRVLLVRQDSRLGNLVLMTPLIEVIGECFPGVRIDVLSSASFADVPKGHPGVENVVVFDKKKARTKPLWAASFVRRLRRERYDLAIDVSDGLHFSLNNVMMTALSNARYRLGYERGNASSFLNMTVPVPQGTPHVTDALVGLIGHYFPGVVTPPMMMAIADDAREHAALWLMEQKLDGDDGYIVIHPGGRGKKQWGIARFAGLINRFGDAYDKRIVVIAGASEFDLIRELKDDCRTDFVLLTGVDVAVMSAVIERCSLFVSNDTGPMHVASALDKPTIGIFVSSSVERYRPRNRLGRAVYAGGAFPDVNDVMIAVLDLLPLSGDKKV